MLSEQIGFDCVLKYNVWFRLLGFSVAVLLTDSLHCNTASLWLWISFFFFLDVSKHNFLNTVVWVMTLYYHLVYIFFNCHFCDYECWTLTSDWGVFTLCFFLCIFFPPSTAEWDPLCYASFSDFMLKSVWVEKQKKKKTYKKGNKKSFLWNKRVPGCV